jgi:hypothetical protein
LQQLRILSAEAFLQFLNRVKASSRQPLAVLHEQLYDLWRHSAAVDAPRSVYNAEAALREWIVVYFYGVRAGQRWIEPRTERR